ncbi:hypothetical protein QFZ56_001959 [Streptomyces achromogenes]|uniref:Alanine-rich protein n=1 Tax=Streptomyces achromogenes TaxID=67255 RepID=A0ABU0PXW9_STRAH|nr:hypothetical protein [Streptomyces achromogenes]MDQ0682996.1 hypothetical protein [Streptomyces achromogenes]
MKASTFVYPWDVIGDPGAPDRIAGLGVEQVTLAAAYHSTRALTPRHPRHRVVTAEHAAVLYPVGDRWAGRGLRPYPAGGWAPGDAFGEAARALAGAGLDVHAWVVLAHNSRLGAEHPHTSVVNAYGDRYPWAPCIAQPGTRAYLVDLAAEAAVRPGANGVELESLGWYGLQHLHAHDKTGGVGLGDAGQYLMALCFCPACRAGYGEQGLDADVLAAAVRDALEPLWRGEADDAQGWAGVEKLLGEETAAATRAWREDRARTLQETAVRAVRAAASDGFQVLLHADPVTHHVGANPGVDPAHILSVADGVVVPCAGGPGLLTPFAEHRREGTVLAANLGVVSGMGGSPGTLAADAARAKEHGATELRLYHAGLASDGDLASVREALAAR